MRILKKAVLGVALLFGVGLAAGVGTSRSWAAEHQSNTEAVRVEEEIFSSGPEYRKSKPFMGDFLLPPNMRSDDRVPCEVALQNELLDDFGVSLKKLARREFSEAFRVVFENSLCKRDEIVEFVENKGAYIYDMSGPSRREKGSKFKYYYNFYYDPGLFSSPIFWRVDYKFYLGFDADDELIMAVWWFNI